MIRTVAKMVFNRMPPGIDAVVRSLVPRDDACLHRSGTPGDARNAAGVNALS
jgi:hypothetical protein